MMPSGVEHFADDPDPSRVVTALPSMMPSGVEHYWVFEDRPEEIACATFYDAFGR